MSKHDLVVAAGIVFALAGCSPSSDVQSGPAQGPNQTDLNNGSASPTPAASPAAPDASTPAEPPLTSENYAEVMERRAREYERMEYKPVTLNGFSCGDNCYVEITRRVEGAAPETVLCTARACADWRDVGALPAALRNKGATAKFGRADQVDGAGKVMKRNVEAIVDLRVPAALKSSVRSSGTGTGPLPLTRGVYVQEGGSCRQPANAFVRIWNGTGLSGSATRACRATVRSRDGDTYQVSNSCENTYDGSRTAGSQTITVPDASHFTLREGGEASARRFRLCPAGETPDSLQRLAR